MSVLHIPKCVTCLLTSPVMLHKCMFIVNEGEFVLSLCECIAHQ